MTHEYRLLGLDAFLSIRMDSIQGLQGNINPFFGGYDVKGSVEIRCNAYYAKGELWFTTGNLYSFYKQLCECYSALKGFAVFNSSDGNLEFSVTFDKRGHVMIRGQYTESQMQDNKLVFDIESDQSYFADVQEHFSKLTESYRNLQDQTAIVTNGYCIT